MNLNTPTDFSEKEEIGENVIEYLNLIEVCQDGPIIGNIRINGKIINSSLRFGSPIAINNNNLYIPVYKNTLLKAGFKLCEINFQTFNVTEIGKIKDLIYINNVENNKLFYFEDVCKTKSSYYELNP